MLTTEKAKNVYEMFKGYHHFDENPRLIYLHAQKQDNLDDVLHEIRNALEKTSCDCIYYIHI